MSTAERRDVAIGVIDGALSHELRRSVLRPHLDPGDPLPGDDRTDVVHFGATGADGQVLSACLIFPEPCPWRRTDGPGWQLRSMATEPAARGQGLAAQVLAAVIDYIAGHEGGVVWCNAREPAVPLYERGGLVVHGEPFVEHGVPHLHMSRIVAPALGPL